MFKEFKVDKNTFKYMIKEFEFDGDIFRIYSRKNGIEAMKCNCFGEESIGWFANVRSALNWCYEYQEVKRVIGM